MEQQIEIVGRAKEITIMHELLHTTESELLVVFGRRRVGKTFLIKNVYKHETVFRLTGLQNATKKSQLENFEAQRNEFFADSATVFESPKNWLQAFAQLKKLLGKPKKKKRVLFFDELPWLANNSNDFLKVFDNFWNSWAVDNNIVVVICGSAASWIIKNIINDTGGLHNRITKKIHLQPFSLFETEQFFKNRKLDIPRENIISIYMALGGIPYYLKEVGKGQSAVVAVNNSCFGKTAPLYKEFDNLYKALFVNYEKHVTIVRALAKKWKGLSRQEIIDETGLNTGGFLTELLDDLETSDFIQSYIPFAKKKRDTLYRLTDEFSLFYLRFIEANKNNTNFWINKFNTPTANAWKGFAFETLCLKHIDGIKNKLGIGGIYTESSSFAKKNTEDNEGFQIDLLIDRADNAINVCEIKYYDGPYNITAHDINHWKLRLNNFGMSSQTKKQLFLTLITANDIVSNKYSSMVDKHITKEALFL